VAAHFRTRAGGALIVDPLEFRGVIGHLATGVTVITTAAGDRLHGMTANAVSSLSLDPVMVLICIDKSTHTHRVLDEGGVFVVNILGEHQEDVSRVFAKKAEPETGTLRGQGFRRGETGAPILDDCLAFLECRVANVVDGGDHSIFLGSVVSEGVVEEMRPLLFYRGNYHRLGG
jgi:flavin reductase (DIM6/NTAB) family NADH-FMN oxidoreductase RutF